MYIQITGRTVCEFTYINTYTQNLYLDTQIHLKYIQFYTHCMNILHAYRHSSKVNDNFKKKSTSMFIHSSLGIFSYYTLEINFYVKLKLHTAVHTYIHATTYKDSTEDIYIYIIYIKIFYIEIHATIYFQHITYLYVYIPI